MSSPNPAFAFVEMLKSNLCPTFVLSIAQTPPKYISGQSLDKSWNGLFSPLQPSHPDNGQKEDELWIGQIQVKLRTRGL